MSSKITHPIDDNIAARCPFRGTRIEGSLGEGKSLDAWWPDRLKVELLHQPSDRANPLGEDFDYAAAFNP